ncbi:MAG: hypothetical protein GY856_37330, partial [bacterium]|nr:hypothetical protein [bacterium]
MSSKTLLPALFLTTIVAGWAVHAGATSLPGVPRPPRPGPLPEAWFGLLNDALGGEIGDNPDDFRTQAFYGATRWRKDWILAADYSILTHKGSDLFDEGRVDELTLTLGRSLYQHEDRSWVVAGLGGRFTSDLGGEGVQNGWHDVVGIDRVELPYEDTKELAAVAYLYGSTLRTRPFGRFGKLAPFVARSEWGFGVDGGALFTSEGELQAQLTGRLAWLGHDGS